LFETLKKDSIENIIFRTDLDEYMYKYTIEEMEDNTVKIDGSIRGFNRIFTSYFNVNQSDLLNKDCEEIEDLEKYRNTFLKHFNRLEKKILIFILMFIKEKDKPGKLDHNKVILFNNEKIDDNMLLLEIDNNFDFLKSMEINERITFPKIE